MTLHQRLGLPYVNDLPFVHSLSGRDTTSYPYFTGKKAWFEAMQTVETPVIELFGENDNEVRPEVIQEAMLLLIKVYSKKDEYFVRYCKFKST